MIDILTYPQITSMLSNGLNGVNQAKYYKQKLIDQIANMQNDSNYTSEDVAQVQAMLDNLNNEILTL